MQFDQIHPPCGLRSGRRKTCRQILFHLQRSLIPFGHARLNLDSQAPERGTGKDTHPGSNMRVHLSLRITAIVPRRQQSFEDHKIPGRLDKELALRCGLKAQEPPARRKDKVWSLAPIAWSKSLNLLASAVKAGCHLNFHRRTERKVTSGWEESWLASATRI